MAHYQAESFDKGYRTCCYHFAGEVVEVKLRTLDSYFIDLQDKVGSGSGSSNHLGDGGA